MYCSSNTIPITSTIATTMPSSVEARSLITGETLLASVPLPPLRHLEAFKLAMHIYVAAQAGVPEEWVTLRWRQLPDTNLVCEYLIQMSLLRVGDGEVCLFCQLPCEDADMWDGRLFNCIRCEPCFLCHRCRADVGGMPVCLSCVESHEVDSLSPYLRRRWHGYNHWWGLLALQQEEATIME